MEVEKVIVTNINRDFSTLKADGETLVYFADEEAEVDFIYLINGHGFHSKTRMSVHYLMSFADIEDEIKDMMNGNRN
ncbi:hypothetical protein [Alkalibacillus almallahensis]|uniref:hypothetical protein n=1 Tax=Alkalibacillus almallahensis TaxID=1379154 RepID=UPI00142184D4|nr:hypothetical protein [Alkalibacillus almallahensis]NIK10908.1 putative TIM-barrel enzyme [Alkalibacillus almallahensis]